MQNWELMLLRTSRKITDVSERYLKERCLERQVCAALEKEIDTLLNSVCRIETLEVFYTWCAEFKKHNYEPLTSRIIIDVKGRNLLLSDVQIIQVLNLVQQSIAKSGVIPVGTFETFLNVVAPTKTKLEFKKDVLVVKSASDNKKQLATKAPTVPYLELACRFVPHGFKENLIDPYFTGSARVPRNSSPTMRSYHLRSLLFFFCVLAIDTLRNVDISRAFPKGNRYSREEWKWCHWPKFVQVSSERMRCLKFDILTILSIVGPLYGTSGCMQRFLHFFILGPAH